MYPLVQVLVVVLALPLRLKAQTANGCPPPTISPAAFANHSFDYIIIGGGTAGLTVASRLAENLAIQVGVIEAGVFHQKQPLIDIPHNIGVAEGNSAFDWAFLSIPQPGIKGQQMPVPRGKMLGGSSGLNFLGWNRASRVEYDAWSSFSSNTGWSFSDLLPFFKRSTTTRLSQANPFPGIPQGQQTADFDPNLVGFLGPIESSYNDIYLDPVFPYVESLNSLGITTNPNPDDGITVGVVNSRTSVSRSTGTRSYATRYYCRSVFQGNLHVLTGALATQILVHEDKHDGLFTASGVKFVVNATEYTVGATRELILSAGAIQSPQLLELSGIGNKTLLESLNITTFIDLPGVGENLQDHLFTAVQYQVQPGVLTFDKLRLNTTFRDEQQAVYNATGKGLLASTDATEAYLPFQLFLDQADLTETLSSFDKSANTLASEETLRSLEYKIQRQWITDGNVPQVELILFQSGQLTPLANASYVTLLAGSLHPIARGSVHINSTSPSAAPIIDQRYLSNDFDVHTILGGLKILLRLQHSAPFSNLVLARTDPDPRIESDADLIDYLRTVTESGSHPAGTVAMGPRAFGGVVGGDLKVHGTSNLRVVDASIMPLIVGAHLQSTVYAIAEKAADIIGATV